MYNQKILSHLATHGILTSVCYGLCGQLHRICWTVTCMVLDGEEFEETFAADTLAQAIEIAYVESLNREWCSELNVVLKEVSPS